MEELLTSIFWNFGAGIDISPGFSQHEAVGMFDRAISVDPYNAGFRINQALLYKVMNRDDDARRAYSEAVNLDQALPGEFDDLFPQ